MQTRFQSESAHSQSSSFAGSVAVSFVTLLAMTLPAAGAIGATGRLSGMVVDQEGAPVGEITLLFASSDHPETPARNLKVSKSGSFAHAFFPAGSYTISLKDSSQFIKSMTYVVKDENGIEVLRLQGDAHPEKGLPPFRLPGGQRVELRLALASAAYQAELTHTIAMAEASGPLKKIKDLYDAGDMPGVIKAATDLLKDHPDVGLGYYLLGLAQSRTNLETEAIESLRKALSMVPDQEGVGGALGTVLLQHSKSRAAAGDEAGSKLLAAEAVAHFKDEIDRFGPSVAFLANQAAALEAIGKTDAFVPALEALVQADPGNLPATLKLATIRTQEGRFDDALALLDKAPRTAPKELATATYNVAAGLLNTGETDKAIATAEKVVALDPSLLAAYRLLGFAYTSKGDKAAAIKNVKKFLELAPNDPDADAERKLLDHLRS